MRRRLSGCSIGALIESEDHSGSIQAIEEPIAAKHSDTYIRWDSSFRILSDVPSFLRALWVGKPFRAVGVGALMESSAFL